MHPEAAPRRARANAPILAVVLAAACALTAGAAAADATAIHACVKPKSGATRIVGANAKCHHGEKKLNWNTAGPRGPSGAPGATGVAGTEGKAGANGVGAVFAAAQNEPVKITTETVVLSKTVPPGAYAVTAKSLLDSEAEATGFAAAICGLVDVPGTSPGFEGQNLDLTVWSARLEEGPAVKSFVADATVAFAGAFTSSVTSTITLGCAPAGTPGPPVVADFPRLQALTVSEVR